jgi:type II secretory ATPase GspE/PulE/Tfp pilus assembly ATPase PilB-like protein
VTAVELRAVGFRSPENRRVMTAKPGGCDACSHSGFHGRMAIYEICVVTKQIEDLITKRATEAQLKEMALKQGFIPMREYGIYKCFDGDTTLEEVVSATAADMMIGEPD